MDPETNNRPHLIRYGLSVPLLLKRRNRKNLTSNVSVAITLALDWTVVVRTEGKAPNITVTKERFSSTEWLGQAWEIHIQKSQLRWFGYLIFRVCPPQGGPRPRWLVCSAHLKCLRTPNRSRKALTGLAAVNEYSPPGGLNDFKHLTTLLKFCCLISLFIYFIFIISTLPLFLSAATYPCKCASVSK